MRAYNTRKSPTPRWERFDTLWIHPHLGEIERKGQKEFEFFARQNEEQAWNGPFGSRKLAEAFLEKLYQPLVESKVS